MSPGYRHRSGDPIPEPEDKGNKEAAVVDGRLVSVAEGMRHGSDRSGAPPGGGVHKPYDNNRDVHLLTANAAELQQCCWFYEGISYQDAKVVLRDADEGTFLVRSSSNPLYLYSLSVKTRLGATSVRIGYLNGCFQLDCADRLHNQMPSFACVLGLVEFYVRLSRRDKKQRCVWMDYSNKRQTPVKLLKPRLLTVPGLKHLCRLQINRTIDDDDDHHHHRTTATVARLPLPCLLKTYVADYPYLL